MSVTIPLLNLELMPGSRVSFSSISWEDYEAIQQELGENRNLRLVYYPDVLEIMSPSAAHERPHRLIAYIVTTILEHQGRDWEDFGSTTLKYPEVAGIEPDTCFYIQNADRARNFTHLDLTKSPPPDLAIECDLTSKTVIKAYEALRVPEVWIYSSDRLQIFVFSGTEYKQVENSLAFPDFPISNLIPQLIQKGMSEGTRKMLGELKTNLAKKQ
ncbi:MAG: Uma2 family endonuclease [Halothece sp. Uz-M2-17]|nr:Uma2 family endonuclease [Halothece sp. Uz-M2-17]